MAGLLAQGRMSYEVKFLWVRPRPTVRGGAGYVRSWFRMIKKCNVSHTNKGGGVRIGLKGRGAG